MVRVAHPTVTTIPPLSIKEQQQISAVLTSSDKEIESLIKQQLADLQQEKNALIQQLLTGKK
ncbi:restriction endonuclease subunit S domain-containing protein [Psychrobacter sanguinis]|uniref:hypothetical protein n=1 Tax=Psychrobacter sanguinis TaxID=861445 RepID=UPI001D15A170|nr:hypothetical protein [Psychrobacter sanguinis]